MKSVLQLVCFALFLQFGSHRAATSEPRPARTVVVLATQGTLQVSTNGGKFKRVRQGEIYQEGAVFRTKGSSTADLYFRRIGAMVRLLPKSELEIEKLQWHANPAGVLVKDTILALRNGRLFAFVRVLFPESAFQIRTEKGLATLNGAGAGRFDISANGRFVVGKSSRSSLKVIVEGQERIIAPGELYSAKDKKVSPLTPSEAESMFLELDELQRLAEILTPPPQPDEIGKK